MGDTKRLRRGVQSTAPGSRGRAIRTFFCLLAMGAVLGGIPARLGAAAVEGKDRAAALEAILKNNESGPPRLMHVDDEMVEFLRKAAEDIKAERYDQAISVLQALIQRGESGFYAEGPGHYVSLRTKARDLIGAMGDKGLRLYRSLYDPQAGRLYEEALASVSPELALRRVAERYMHTTHGPKAISALAEIYFDRGRFSQAAMYWRRLLSLAPQGERRAAVLSRIAVAQSLGGESEKARAVAEQIREQYADVKTSIGGRDEKLCDFVDRMIKMGPMAGAGAPVGQELGWPGLGGLGDGVGVMGECDVVLVPHARWPEPDEDLLELKDVTPKLKSGAQMYLSNRTVRIYGPRGSQTGQRMIQLRDGHLQQTGMKNSSGPGVPSIVLPPMTHVAVADGRVFVRGEQRVWSLSLDNLSGAWASVALPMVRPLPSMNANIGYYGSAGQFIGDNGRYALTAGGGKVFTVYDFLPANNNLGYQRRRQPGLTGLDEGSCLAALSIQGQCMVLWSVGRGQGGADVIRGGMFLTAPTYHAGRLYAMVHYLQSYVLVCLEAETGKLIWQTQIAQAPAMRSYHPYHLGPQGPLAVGSPPAVSDGRVYVTTNAGSVAAVEAETGEPLWGHQYGSSINRNGGASHSSSRYRTGVWSPGNPLIASHGLIVCLPADATSVLALEADTGKVKWTVPRNNQDDLTAIDADRVLVSGEGMAVYRVSDGKRLSETHSDLDIIGRPAVTGRRVLASSMGKIYVMDLKSYSVTPLPLSRADGQLGNLVSAGGRLIASSMLGVCSYLSFDMAVADLDEQIARTPEPQRPKLLLRKAHLAFDARRFDLAVKTLLQCAKIAARHRNNAALGQIRPLIYRTYVALANRETSPEAMLRLFQKALEHAETNQEKAHMALRVAKCLERCDRIPGAVAAAQKLLDRFGDEDIVDVEIGEDADDATRFPATRKSLPARRIAEQYINRLIEIYGRECYAKFDDKAAAALNTAREAGDAEKILAVQHRWPNSRWSDDSLFYAAEAHYRRAQADPNVAPKAVIVARRHLDAVFRNPESTHRASAGAALAVIYTRNQWRTLAHNMIAALREFEPDTEVAFADITGPLDVVLKDLKAGQDRGVGRLVVEPGLIRPGLVEKFAFKDSESWLLVDQAYQPVRIDDRVVMINEGDAVLLDVSKAKGEADWRTPAGLHSSTVKATTQPGMRLVGALSKDRRTLAVAGRVSARGIDVVTGKTKWHAEYSKMGLGSFFCMGAGEGVLVVADTSGRVICLDLSNGKKLGASLVAGKRSRLPYAEPIVRAGLAVFRSDNSRTITVLSLSRQRVIACWTAKQRAEAEVTPDGMLLLMLDGVLTAREPGDLEKPVWEVKYDVNKHPGILATSKDLVAVASDAAGGPVHVLSITGAGRKLASLDMGRFDDVHAQAFAAAFDRGSLLVMCSAWQSLPRRGQQSNLNTVRGLCLQKFNLADGKLVWRAEMENRTTVLPKVLPMVIGTNHVAVTARRSNAAQPYYVHVVRLKDGKVVQKLDLHSSTGKAASAHRRAALMNPPAMTHGRLVVETAEGVSVYGEK